MAKTHKQKQNRKAALMKPKQQPRTVFGVKTAHACHLDGFRATLVEEMKAGSVQEKWESLLQAGIVTKKGKLSPKYQSRRKKRA